MKKIGTHKERDRVIRVFTYKKNVLDLGSANHGRATDLFNLLRKNTHTLVGLDRIKCKNPLILQGDAQKLWFNELFDVVVAGELIEHCEDPQGLILGVKRALKHRGVFILTTPNSVSPWWWFKGCVNDEHVAWYDKDTLDHLLRRFGLRPILFVHYSRETRSPLNWFYQRVADRFPRLHVHVLVVAIKW